jgi:hypothetical protein
MIILRRPEPQLLKVALPLADLLTPIDVSVARYSSRCLNPP